MSLLGAADLLALAEQQALALAVLEDQGAAAATRTLRAAIAQVRRTALGLWLMRAGPLTATPPRDVLATIRAAVRSSLQQAAASITGATVRQLLTVQAQDALDVGVRHAVAQLAGAPAQVGSVVLDAPTRAVLAAAGPGALAWLREAAAAASTVKDGAGLQATLGTADRAVRSLDMASRMVTNGAANTGTRQVAEASGARLVWVAERNACLTCLALAGHVIDPSAGEGFDENATFGTYAPDVWPPGMPLMRPPRHPHCRCQVVAYLGTAGGAPDLPSRLRHEALRSVLKGWSLPSESHRARLQAAERLLRSGGAAQLPKSVRAEAVRAVAAGRFRSRAVPAWDRTITHKELSA